MKAKVKIVIEWEDGTIEEHNVQDKVKGNYYFETSDVVAYGVEIDEFGERVVNAVNILVGDSIKGQS